MDLSKKNVIKPLKQAVKIKGSEETNSHEIVLFGGTNSNIPKVRDQNGRRMGEKKEAKRRIKMNLKHQSCIGLRSLYPIM